ncbi:acyl-CoA reductase-like NAD-dependent aldehyde dehydrogenase [Arcanobacterium pluranimalium]|uniref:succinic semialdehyde dehydrogenase n=1 Tax=Arcanobacterium pluranimalium TaxID=108028 RepID=UPI00195EDCBF|nr:succinic semialdehyde dehydrogenase [Arcanobacterium pluranimalium]MBM7824760.1 acyl-CoA reductase-like NAD-dependent aldehyde dehydrogenase [Arcanobacterium pluranimalium]
MTETLSSKKSSKEFSKLDERGRQALESLAPRVQELCSTDPQSTPVMEAKTSALTDSVIAELPVVRAGDLDAVFARAREVAKVWAATDVRERKRLVLAFVDAVLANRDAILDVIQWENGKSRGSAYEEVYDVALNSRFYAKHAEKILRSKRVPGAVPGLTHTQINYIPKGVVGIISPWNYPFNLAASDAIAAIMAGNSVVLKPDSQTPFSALVVKSLMERAGLPRDLFQVVIGSGRELGTPMIEQSNYMMFTGSTATGRSIAQRAGENLIGCSAELGGKNAMIIRADAPVDRAAAAAVKACFSSSGQLCISIERLYVHRDIWDDFVPKFVARVKAMNLEASMDWKADIGPLINDSQVEKVTEHINDAVAKGAKVLAGGHLVPEVSKRAFLPTVLEGVTPDMHVFGEETFGPLVSLYPFETDEQALSLVNATNYGLNSAIWSGNVKIAQSMALRVEAGTVNINDGYAAAWGSIHAPSGGFKDSGLSHRHGEEGIVKYTDVQTVATQRLMHIGAPKILGEKVWARILHSYLKVQRRFDL